MIDTVLAAVGDVPVVVVGPARATARPVHTVVEEPRGGGPAAGVVAGLRALNLLVPRASIIAVLAADLPGLTSVTISRLCAALDDSGLDHREPAARGSTGVALSAPGVIRRAPGAVLVDAEDREQWLTGVWRVAALRSAVRTKPDWTGASVRSLLSLPGTRLVTGTTREVTDIDTPGDAAAWRRQGDGSSGQNRQSGTEGAE